VLVLLTMQGPGDSGHDGRTARTSRRHCPSRSILMSGRDDYPAPAAPPPKKSAKRRSICRLRGIEIRSAAGTIGAGRSRAFRARYKGRAKRWQPSKHSIVCGPCRYGMGPSQEPSRVTG
jgi:hypothetical protein